MEKAFIIAVFGLFALGVLSGEGTYIHSNSSGGQYVSSRSVLASDNAVYNSDAYNNSTTGYVFYTSDIQPNEHYVDPLIGYQFYLEDLKQNGPRYLK